MHSLLLSSFMAGSLNADGSFQAEYGSSERGGKNKDTPKQFHCWNSDHGDHCGSKDAHTEIRYYRHPPSAPKTSSWLWTRLLLFGNRWTEMSLYNTTHLTGIWLIEGTGSGFIFIWLSLETSRLPAFPSAFIMPAYQGVLPLGTTDSWVDTARLT